MTQNDLFIGFTPRRVAMHFMSSFIVLTRFLNHRSWTCTCYETPQVDASEIPIAFGKLEVKGSESDGKHQLFEKLIVGTPDPFHKRGIDDLLVAGAFCFTSDFVEFMETKEKKIFSK